MFTKEDYITYFDELENVSKKILVIYTDLMNEVADQSLRSKLYALTSESMEGFKFIKEAKDKFV